ncbi:MAG TPA: DUF302 domain-containing protein [Dehalococcoidia bacterium]|nr:DUF302 domain-containing protein [Dehalococcoidia bacterium]
MSRTVPAPFAETVERVKALLRDEGFGVLTEIDVQGTMQQKLGKDMRPYVILGACNPPLASRALDAEPEIGLLLPCNVVVAEREGGTWVGAVNPQSLVPRSGSGDLQAVADEADVRLRRVLERLA